MEVDISAYTEVEDKVFENMAPSLSIFARKKKKKERENFTYKLRLGSLRRKI